MPELNDSTRDPELLEDCPLPVSVQNRNIWCFAIFWSVYYLAAPITYIGLTHANLLKAFGNSDTVSNLPSAYYLWFTALQVVAAWLFPSPRHVKPLAYVAVGLMVTVSAAVAVTLGSGASPRVATIVVIVFGAVFGAANGVLLTSMWDSLRRGVSTSRRGKALGLTFGIGPLFACVGSLLQDAVFDGRLLGGRSFGLTFPYNYMAMFAAVAPLLLIAGIAVAMFRIPLDKSEPSSSQTPLAEMLTGLKQFVNNRNVLIAVLLYVLVYSGGNAIFPNISLHAKTVLGSDTDTLGIQSFLRFGCKAVAGALLGWLLATVSPRATLMATTSILIIGVAWAIGSTGWWYMAAFGIMGAGELFGAYFPNYVTTASRKQYVRVNMAYLNVLSALTGLTAVLYGQVADRYGRVASFYLGGAMLLVAMILIRSLLPANPTPIETTSAPETPA